MASNEEYWEERQHSLQDRAMERGQQYYERIIYEFNRATFAIKKEIESFYARFAEENEISYQEAKKLLTSKERDQFQMTLDEYMEKGRTLNLAEDWMHELENASTVYRISRLESLMIDIRQKVEVLTASYDDGLTEVLGEVYEEGYYMQTHALNVAMGFNVAFNKIDSDFLQILFDRPWAADDLTFSDRIWGERERLINALDTHLIHGFMKGDSKQSMIAALAKDMDVSKYKAGRLIVTEAAFYSAAAAGAAYHDQGVKRFKFIATLDEKTCPICGGLESSEANRQGFPIDDYQPGLNAEPLHARCRCHTMPIDDPLDPIFGNLWDDVPGKRATRDKDGKYTLISRDMTYNEWKEKFVD